jgi:hypothetical protein
VRGCIVPDADHEAFDLEVDGACRHAGLALPLLPDIEAALARWPADRAGVRITGSRELARLLGPGLAIGALAADACGQAVRPVRAVLFDKSNRVDWALGWHQDRTIAVRERCDTAGFGPWSVKQGITHVEPPFAVIEAMLTLRIHLDPVDADNAPLLIAAGSHRRGRVATGEVEDVVRGSTVRACLAEVGDVWIYRTPILHASNAARPGRRRRVLQVDYASQGLPAGLEWLGI